MANQNSTPLSRVAHLPLLRLISPKATNNNMHPRFLRVVAGICLWAALQFVPLIAEEPARFVRAVNLNGPALLIDDRQWEGKESSFDLP